MSENVKDVLLAVLAYAVICNIGLSISDSFISGWISLFCASLVVSLMVGKSDAL